MKGGFFQVKSPSEFVELLKGYPALPHETASLEAALGRTLAEDIISREDLPLVNRSCMDGFAVIAKDVFGATEANPAYLETSGEVSIETPPDFELEPGECATIVTGGTLPENSDAVVMVEYTADLGAGTVEMRKSAAPGDNVMLRGEDAQTGKVALPVGTAIRPQEVGLLAALGFPEIPVCRRPKCGIISTGDELIDVTETPKPGQVRDVNSHALAALVRQAGAKPVLYGLVRDEEEELTAALHKAIEENDVVFISGGSSIGVRDLTQGAIEALPDAEVLAHGVAVSPGKPTILARVGTKAVWGLPGQVTSAQVVMLTFGLPYLRHIQGDAQAFNVAKRVTVKATLARNLHSKQGREDYVRVRIENGEAHPVLGKSGLLRTMILADGLVTVPADSEGIEAGTEVDVWLMS